MASAGLNSDEKHSDGTECSPIVANRLSKPVVVDLSNLYGIASEAENTAKIRSVLEPLLDHGVDTELFTEKSVIESGLTTKQFVKLARTVTGSHFNSKMVAKVLEIGAKMKICSLPNSITVKQLCYFLKTRAGQKEIKDAQRTLKLSKKRKGAELETDQIGGSCEGARIRKA